MKLTKSKNDEKKEAKDLTDDPTLVFLANINSYKFNVGDVLIKKILQWDDEGENKVLSVEVDKIGAPIKYVYAFENKIGVGYIKKLKNDGKGPSKSNPMCITKVVQADQHLFLDPDYVEHLLLSADEEFKYNARYERLQAFREEAIKKNAAIAVEVYQKPTNADEAYDENNPEPTKAFKAFWKALKIGDVIYASDGDIEELGQTKLEVLSINKTGSHIKFKILKDEWGWRDVGSESTETKKGFAQEWCLATTQRPYPLTEDGI